MSDAAIAEPAAPADLDIEAEDARSARQKVLDHFEDSEGPQTTAQILAGTGLDRSVLDSVLSRLVKNGALHRQDKGVYELAPPAPPPPPEPPKPPAIIQGYTVDQWFDAILKWRADPASWDVAIYGPSPFADGNLVPLPALAKLEAYLNLQDRQRAEDSALLEKLLGATFGNINRAPGHQLLDLRPIFIAIASGVDLDAIVRAVKRRCDPRPHVRPPAPLASWSETDLLERIAAAHAETITDKLVKSWSESIKTPDPKTNPRRAPAVTAIMSKIAPPKTADAPDASPATASLPESRSSGFPDAVLREAVQEVAAMDPAAPVPEPADILIAKFGAAAAAAPVAVGREAVLQAWRRNRSPAAPSDSQAERQAPALSPIAPAPTLPPWDDLVDAYRRGNLRWPHHLVGPPPDQPGFRGPAEIQRRYGFLR